ncbi:MAG: M4 family metallopeptidase [Myxococcaceae bacterium]|nr:M4 family metallopeptidase [Myxococcaceae bacterium]
MTARPAPTLSPAQLAVHKSQQASRVTRAHDTLMSLRRELSLSEREGFTTRNAFTNTQGQAIVRMNQTYDGFRVWGGQAIAHVLPDGSTRTLTRGVQSGIRLEGAPTLSAAQARDIALKNLAPMGPMPDAPRIERVVFPTRFAAVDPQTGRTAVERQSFAHPEPAAAYVWAYEVRTRLHNRQDGLKELAYVVDGKTGNVLHVRDELQRQAAPTPAQGNGYGFYRGPVTLDTTEMTDSTGAITYALWDTTRGTLPNPGVEWATQGDGTSWNPTGMQVWYGENDSSGVYTWRDWVFAGNPTNNWGNGELFTDWGNEGGPNGQTAGVDAMSAMATTWDFYKNVFQRDGMDGNGTSIYAQVLMTYTGYQYESAEHASWSSWAKGLDLGAGSYPAHPNRFLSMTDLDVIAHEMAHGVTESTANFVNSAGYEGAGLSEATSDFLAQMVKAYATRGASDPADVIPNTGADWRIAAGPNRGTPLRWMDRPSNDLRSTDAWYDGVKYLDGHYSSGALNRALFFLAQGASATEGAANHSVYLPGGMTGIGNDAAARIWFKAVTERLVDDGTGSLTFMDARTEALAAAEELYGAGSPEAIAVENAFAAVNVGEALGQAPRTQVLFANWRNGDYIEMNHPWDGAHRQYFPKGEAVVPRITVLNNADTRVRWSIGGPSMFNGAEYNIQVGGRLNANGSWTTPNQMSWHSITATSVADPTQFAEGRVFLINMDMDTDTEQDALDMGGIAASWFLSNGLNMNHSVYQAPWVDNDDVATFVDAMRATWPVK